MKKLTIVTIVTIMMLLSMNAFAFTEAEYSKFEEARNVDVRTLNTKELRHESSHALFIMILVGLRDARPGLYDALSQQFAGDMCVQYLESVNTLTSKERIHLCLSVYNKSIDTTPAIEKKTNQMCKMLGRNLLKIVMGNAQAITDEMNKNMEKVRQMEEAWTK